MKTLKKLVIQFLVYLLAMLQGAQATVAETVKPAFTFLHIVNNTEGLYPGNLRYYFKIFLLKAINVGHVYHGLTHTIKVTWDCYRAGKEALLAGLITAEEFRDLLIAAIFHDWDHSDKTTGDDTNELLVACAGLETWILPQDRPNRCRIRTYMWATLFKDGKRAETHSVGEEIISDADIQSQTFCETWMQIILIGLGRELGMSVMQMIEMQPKFISKYMVFKTPLFQREISPERIAAKLEHVAELKGIMDEPIPQELSAEFLKVA